MSSVTDERGIHYQDSRRSTVKVARFPPPFHGRWLLLFHVAVCVISALGCPDRTCVTPSTRYDVTVHSSSAVVEFAVVLEFPRVGIADVFSQNCSTIVLFLSLLFSFISSLAALK